MDACGATIFFLGMARAYRRVRARAVRGRAKKINASSEPSAVGVPMLQPPLHEAGLHYGAVGAVGLLLTCLHASSTHASASLLWCEASSDRLNRRLCRDLTPPLHRRNSAASVLSGLRRDAERECAWERLSRADLQHAGRSLEVWQCVLVTEQGRWILHTVRVRDSMFKAAWEVFDSGVARSERVVVDGYAVFGSHEDGAASYHHVHLVFGSASEFTRFKAGSMCETTQRRLALAHSDSECSPARGGEACLATHLRDGAFATSRPLLFDVMIDAGWSRLRAPNLTVTTAFHDRRDREGWAPLYYWNAMIPTTASGSGGHPLQTYLLLTAYSFAWSESVVPWSGVLVATSMHTHPKAFRSLVLLRGDLRVAGLDALPYDRKRNRYVMSFDNQTSWLRFRAWRTAARAGRRTLCRARVDDDSFEAVGSELHDRQTSPVCLSDQRLHAGEPYVLEVAHAPAPARGARVTFPFTQHVQIRMFLRLDAPVDPPVSLRYQNGCQPPPYRGVYDVVPAQ